MSFFGEGRQSYLLRVKDLGTGYKILNGERSQLDILLDVCMGILTFLYR